jgi:hypothetical protein
VGTLCCTQPRETVPEGQTPADLENDLTVQHDPHTEVLLPKISFPDSSADLWESSQCQRPRRLLQPPWIPWSAGDRTKPLHHTDEESEGDYWECEKFEDLRLQPQGHPPLVQINKVPASMGTSFTTEGSIESVNDVVPIEHVFPDVTKLEEVVNCYIQNSLAAPGKQIAPHDHTEVPPSDPLSDYWECEKFEDLRLQPQSQVSTSTAFTTEVSLESFDDVAPIEDVFPTFTKLEEVVDCYLQNGLAARQMKQTVAPMTHACLPTLQLKHSSEACTTNANLIIKARSTPEYELSSSIGYGTSIQSARSLASQNRTALFQAAQVKLRKCQQELSELLLNHSHSSEDVLKVCDKLVALSMTIFEHVCRRDMPGSTELFEEIMETIDKAAFMMTDIGRASAND